MPCFVARSLVVASKTESGIEGMAQQQPELTLRRRHAVGCAGAVPSGRHFARQAKHHLEDV
jgi:hypothetical protein